jgi:DHA1 family bicyclomycin/chloramphenicol resistance-like MFS transporter
MAQIMSMIMSVFMIVPIVAPNVGQVILLTAPWQGIFFFMGVIGITFGTWAYFRLDETMLPENRRPLTVQMVTQGFAIVVGNRMALFYGLAGIFLFGAVLGFVNTAQQIYVGIYGLGALFPLAFAVGPVAFAVSFLLNSRLVGRHGMRRLAHGAMLSYIGITGLWAVLSAVGMMPLWAFLAFLAASTLMQGFAWGNVGSLSMEPLGEVAGTASAVFGTFSTVGAAIIGYAVAQSFNGTTTPLIVAYFVLGLLVVGCFLIAERGRLLHPQTPDAAAPSIAPV